jgi:hypothetical protein
MTRPSPMRTSDDGFFQRWHRLRREVVEFWLKSATLEVGALYNGECRDVYKKMLRGAAKVYSLNEGDWFSLSTVTEEAFQANNGHHRTKIVMAAMLCLYPYKMPFAIKIEEVIPLVSGRLLSFSDF